VCHTLHLLVICFAPSLADSFIFLTLTRLVVVFIFVNFSFALFTPPLGDFHIGQGKSKGFRGDRSNQGPEKRTRLVIRPVNQNRSSSRPPSYPFKQPIIIRPATAPTSTSQPSAPGARFLALPSSSTGCFNCGKSDHFIKDCPYPRQNKSNNQQNSESSNQGKGNMANNSAGKNIKKTGQIYYTQVATTPEGEPVMMSTFLVANHPVVILFDSGASHTFISKKFVENIAFLALNQGKGLLFIRLGDKY
jgi:hypothetical protein